MTTDLNRRVAEKTPIEQLRAWAEEHKPAGWSIGEGESGNIILDCSIGHVIASAFHVFIMPEAATYCLGMKAHEQFAAFCAFAAALDAERRRVTSQSASALGDRPAP